MLAVAFEVGLGAEHVGDFLFRPRWDGLVGLELRNARLVRSRNVVVRCVLAGHGESFGRHHRQRMPIFGGIPQVSTLVPWGRRNRLAFGCALKGRSRRGAIP